jgi:hypothetical protein
MKDLLTIRELEFDGIKIHIEIDRQRGQISLIEPDGCGGFQPKRWLFNERELRYARTWLKILDAMRKVVEHGIEELGKVEEDKTVKMVESAHVALNSKEEK